MSLITIEHLTKSYTERLLFDDTAFSINEGEKVGLIGINGTGKSTLLLIQAVLDDPDDGSVVRRRNLYIRYLPQIPAFTAGDTVLDAIVRDNRDEPHFSSREEIEASAKNILTRLGIYDFDEKVEHLSGGQRKRVALTSVLLSTADLLILDEPTNHLDSEMADWLEEYLKKFRGALLMITHDRYFLDRMVRRIFAFEGDGKVVQYEGGFTDYQVAYLMKHPELTGGTAGGKGAAGRDSTGNAGAADGDSESGGAAKKSSQEGRAHQKKLKFSFKEQREWDTIEDEIAGLEADLETLDGQIAESATNYGRLNQLMTEKAEKEALLEEKMDRWMYLQELAEKIAAQS